MKKNINISISDVAKFIAYEHPTQQALNKLDKLDEFSKKVVLKMKFLQDKVNELILKEIFGDYNYYTKSII